MNMNLYVNFLNEYVNERKNESLKNMNIKTKKNFLSNEKMKFNLELRS